MPTAYTGDLYDGKEVDFPTFVLTCARAFCIDLRETPDDVLPTEERARSESSYYERSLTRDRARLAQLLIMSEDEIAEAAHAAWTTVCALHAESREKNKRLRHRYEAMLAAVDVWEPPTDEHQGLKDFMAQQLTSSIEHDCREVIDPDPYVPDVWWRGELARTRRMIKEDEDEIRAQRLRVEHNAGWIKALRESIGA